MKNSEYWRERFQQLEEAQNQIGWETYAEIEQQYRRAWRELEGRITAWYQRFATNNKMSMAEARKLLFGIDLKEFKWDIQDYIKYGKENAIHQRWMKELENASARFHISRLEALKLQTQQSLELMFGNQLDCVDFAMKRIYLDSYYHTAYELQKGFQIGWDIAEIDQKQIEKVISKPWAADGKNFSERIWRNKEKLISEVHKELTQNIMLGQDPQKAIDNLAKKMNTSKNNAGRLVMTEEAYFSSAAQKDCFHDLDVEQYEIVATLDSHTSDICQNMDGKVFPMKDFEPGVTAPPFHVYCRSTTVPYFDENFGQVGKRTARNSNGKTYHVSADMTYGEWKKRHVVDEKNIENKVADCLIRNHTLKENIEKERVIVEEAIASIPKKVQQALQQGTIIDIGKKGASQYDYIHDILYVAKGAEKQDVIHEIGHMVENKMLSSEKVSALMDKLIGDVSVFDIVSEIYEDASGNPREVFLLKNEKFVSDYQGRLYVSNPIEAFYEDGRIKKEVLMEFISEPFRVYVMDQERLKEKFQEFYELLREVVE